jgi:hypothetical protein
MKIILGKLATNVKLKFEILKKLILNFQPLQSKAELDQLVQVKGL